MSVYCWSYRDMYVFFFKQKTAYEMRISDWSSDVCSSDLSRLAGEDDVGAHHATTGRMYGVDSSWRQFRAVAGKLHSGRGCWNCRAHKSGTSAIRRGS